MLRQTNIITIKTAVIVFFFCFFFQLRRLQGGVGNLRCLYIYQCDIEHDVIFSLVSIFRLKNCQINHAVCRICWCFKRFLMQHSLLNGPRQANLCLRAFRHDKFQLRMPSHSEGPRIWLSV